jgi:hypothetical protein
MTGLSITPAGVSGRSKDRTRLKMVAEAGISFGISEPRLSVGSTNDVYQFRYFLTLIGLVAAGDRVFNTM